MYMYLYIVQAQLIILNIVCSLFYPCFKNIHDAYWVFVPPAPHPLQKFDPRLQQTSFACLEIHVGGGGGGEGGEGGEGRVYRVFCHHGILEKRDSKVDVHV